MRVITFTLAHIINSCRDRPIGQGNALQAVAISTLSDYMHRQIDQGKQKGTLERGITALDEMRVSGEDDGG